MDKLRHLNGMRDLPQGSWAPLKATQDLLREQFYLHGYQVIETPFLEPTELFLRKSGGELASQMYTFTDPGGNEVSLRPEFTSSVVRHYLMEDASEQLPIRVQYAGPVFRYEGASPERSQKVGNLYRQFNQVGAELLGSSSPRADAEVLSLSYTALTSLGLTGHRLEIGDLGVLYRLLTSLELSDRAIAFIFSSVAALTKGQEGLDRTLERAKQLGLLGADAQHGYLASAIANMEEGEARELLQGLLDWAEVGSLGQRQHSEVVDRLLRKFRGSDDPDRLRHGLEIAYTLAKVSGEPEACLSEVAHLIRSFGLNESALDRLREVMELLDAEQEDSASVVLDFGLARGFAYYTGVVFEIGHPAIQGSIGGGGRYDGLATALGSPSNIPALGFAYTLEHLLEALELVESGCVTAQDQPKRVLILAPDATAYRKALRLAQQLRGEGSAVYMDVNAVSLEESHSYATALGIGEVIVVDGDGKSTKYEVQARSEQGRREGFAIIQ